MPVELKRAPWLLIEGAVLILLGVIALFAPFAAGIAAATVVGWILIASGSIGLIMTLIGDMHIHGWPRGWGIGSALIALAVGAVLVLFPLVATEGLILLVGAYLLMDGVVMIGTAFSHRKTSRRWGGLMALGVLDVILAVVLILLNATASALLVGVFVGVDLVVAGGVLLALHWSAHPPALGHDEIGAKPGV
jgi:uncharacterized membrane protein HdeD (DUF308 family)